MKKIQTFEYVVMFLEILEGMRPIEGIDKSKKKLKEFCAIILKKEKLLRKENNEIKEYHNFTENRIEAQDYLFLCVQKAMELERNSNGIISIINLIGKSNKKVESNILENNISVTVPNLKGTVKLGTINKKELNFIEYALEMIKKS